MSDLKAAALRALKLMDLTTLNDDDTDEKVISLCHGAESAVGNTAAICIYPRFIPIAKKTLREQGTPDVRIATVTNFPHGNDDIDIAVAETKAAVAYGGLPIKKDLSQGYEIQDQEFASFADGRIAYAIVPQCGAVFVLIIKFDLYYAIISRKQVPRLVADLTPKGYSIQCL